MLIRGMMITVFALFTSAAHAASSGGGFGLNVGLGMPFLSQAGLNYQFSDRFGMSAGYNLFDVKVGTAGAKLSMPEILFNYHPFSGSFFVGVGAGQEKLEVTSGNVGVDEVSIDVEAMTTILKTGWMWGASNGGFWFGMDVSYISPSGAKQTIKAPGVPVTDKSYTDAVDAADQFGKTSYMNITFARFGWLF